MSHREGYDRVQAVTTSDAGDNYFEGFTVGVAGNVVVTDRYGNTATIACVAGTLYPIRTAKIQATGTTATGIVGYN